MLSNRQIRVFVKISNRNKTPKILEPLVCLKLIYTDTKIFFTTFQFILSVIFALKHHKLKKVAPRVIINNTPSPGISSLALLCWLSMMFHSCNLCAALLLLVIVIDLPSGGNSQEVSFLAKKPSTLFTTFGGTLFKNVSRNIGNGYNPQNGKNIFRNCERWWNSPKSEYCPL